MTAATASHAQGRPLNERDVDQVIALIAGREARMELETNPSTGYAWRVAASSNVKAIEPFATRSAPQKRMMTGVPETAIIRIIPQRRGPASLTLVYARPFERDAAPAKRLHFRFVLG